MTADTPRTNGQQSGSGIDDSQATACEILDVLGDQTCRSILSVTTDEQLTVEEIATRCAIPLSTAYRKVDKIVNTGLLTSHEQFREQGSPVNTYKCHVDDIVITLENRTGPRVSVQAASD